MSFDLPRPSVYTPFLRRFTDERAKDLKDTIALYDEVRAAHLASVWSNDDIIDGLNTAIAEIVADSVTLPASHSILTALDRCQTAVLALEDTFFKTAEVHWDVAVLSLTEQVDLRRFLRAQQHFLANDDRSMELLIRAIALVTLGVLSELPDLPEDGDAAFTVPLISLVNNPHDLIDRIIGTIARPELAELGICTTLHQRVWENVCAASGVPPDQEPRRPLVTAADSPLPPLELVETYLKNTPYLDFLRTPIPFAIPEAIRFEHTHIVAGTGHGKTQTLQHLILHDLARDPDNVPALVIIDSQGDLISKLQQLDCFDPDHGALADRIVIIDPTDVEHPPALGLFDVNLSRVRGYGLREREQIMNGIIELYEFIFGGLLGAELTQKQNVLFRYLARLMTAIPDATILTLRDVMQDSAPFVHHFDSLDGMARDFFRHEFNDRQFAETKKQILRRLWGVLENPTFERLFSNPRNTLDMFDALNSGKIVLINTAKDFLKEERSSILGRFFIALTFQAAMERAAISEDERRPAFLYIDEAADYFDDTIDSLLTQARKMKLGVVFAHQYLDQLPRPLMASIMANTSIKLAGGVSASDANMLARNMGTTHEFISGVRKRKSETEFAGFVRNLTGTAVTLTVPFGSLDSMPRMSPAAFARLIEINRERYAAPRLLPRPEAASRDNPRQGTARPAEQRQASTAPREIPSPEETLPINGAGDDDWRS